MVAGSDLVPRLTSPQSLGIVMGRSTCAALGTIPAAAIELLGSAVGTPIANWIWLALALGSAIPSFTLHDRTARSALTGGRQPRTERA